MLKMQKCSHEENSKTSIVQQASSEIGYKQSALIVQNSTVELRLHATPAMPRQGLDATFCITKSYSCHWLSAELNLAKRLMKSLCSWPKRTPEN